MPTTYSKEPLTSLGLQVSIALETTAKTRPTTGYYKIPMATALPDMDWENDTIDTTSYDNLVNHSYLPGLKDTGGLLSIEANFSTFGIKMWDALAQTVAADTAGKVAWLMIDIKGTETKYFIPVIPAETGVPDAPVNDKISINYNFTAAGDVVKDDVANTETYYSTYTFTS